MAACPAAGEALVTPVAAVVVFIGTTSSAMEISELSGVVVAGFLSEENGTLVLARGVYFFLQPVQNLTP